MPFKIKMELGGIKDALKSLDGLKRGVQRRILRAAVTEASAPILQSARGHAPKRTGTFKRSLGKKVKTYSKSGTVVAIVGPRKGYKTQTGITRKGKEIFEDPTKIAHLLEYGHLVVRGGKVVGHAPAYPSMTPAMQENQSRAVETIARRIGEEIEKEAAKR